jgi:peptidoglycan-associated lipoprotein
VFFACDKARIRAEQRDALASGIAWLLANPEVTVTIEGHCDERGTSEYNLSLGERRANVVRDYLVAAGVPAERIRTLSYGEERPLVPAQDKSTWKFNRRAHFVVVKQ